VRSSGFRLARPVPRAANEDHRPYGGRTLERILMARVVRGSFLHSSFPSGVNMTEDTEKTSSAERASDLAQRAAGMSDEVLKSLESGQRSAIDAVRKFVDTVEESLPGHTDDEPSRRETIVDAALDMADKLVKTQYDFIRSVVSSASDALKTQGDKKSGAE
jgi:hypothetical protein